ncbi:GTP-binding protein ERG-like [Phragmites australis]|nr:GTP-binding protein ERG-like [Phragmites australis]XP_062192858.1 GTP-binding protein ERG-like [Phragmites australis]XP_062192859.1 GTP-binding protein ERG-like [Phragmites australis]
MYHTTSPPSPTSAFPPKQLSLKPSAAAAAGMRRFLRALLPLQTVALNPAPAAPFPLRLLSSSSTSSAAAPSDPDSAPAADADFDSAEYALPTPGPAPSRNNPVAALRKLRFDPSLRARADEALFGNNAGSGLGAVGEEEEERSRDVALALLEAALEPPDEDEGPGEVREEDQMSLSVGIVGAPNAGKSSLTNTMVGTKVAAVSRKTNTTTHEILGVLTKGNKQICFFDTPGLMLGHHGFPHRDVMVRVESAWSSINLYDLLIVMFDVNRHLKMPDSRVIKLIKRLGAEVNPNQRRILCMNKVDLVEDKKDLLKVAKEFEGLPGYERYFMVSGLKGKGVKDLVQYLMDQAVQRPWDEESTAMTEELMKTISLEVVREKMLHHIHQEIPYVIEHRLMDWKELKDGSLRVEQHFIAPKQSQRQILVGKNGSKIGRIGIEANEELRSIFKRDVHLILQVRVAKKRSA